jgi:hypothetical protein
MIALLLWARFVFLAACAVVAASYVWIGREPDQEE